MRAALPGGVAKPAPPIFAVLRLLADYAHDIHGRPDGLTTHELARAWAARHGAAMPSRPDMLLRRLYTQGLAKRSVHRCCAVSGRYMLAWLPTVGAIGSTNTQG